MQSCLPLSQYNVSIIRDYFQPLIFTWVTWYVTLISNCLMKQAHLLLRFINFYNLPSIVIFLHFNISDILRSKSLNSKGKGVPRQAEVALGVPGRLRPRIISTFGTTRVVGRQPNAPAAFTRGENTGTPFQRLSRRQGTWFCRNKSPQWHHRESISRPSD